MSIDIKYAKEARQLMCQGIEKLYNAVKVTLGPKGRNVVIEEEFDSPLITNDGVTIAKAFELDNQYENIGAKMLIEAASKTNDMVGDGTTTAIILATNIILEGLKALDQGVNPIELKQGLQYYLNIIIKKINKVSKPIKNIESLKRVACISSGSLEAGKLIADAYSEVGTKALITIQESRGNSSFVETTKGYSFDRSLISSYLADENGNLELNNPLILITNKKISMMQEIVPYLEIAIKKEKPILIICDDMEDAVLNAVVLNNMRGVFKAAVVKAPSYGENMQKMLKDMCVYTNATLIDSYLSTDFKDKESLLGIAEKVIITKDKTTIINNSSSNLDSYINQLENELANAKYEFDIDKLKERISKLRGGVGIINVCAPTEIELQEYKLRIEDAINATKAAIDQGIIEGGGKVFYEIALELDNTKDDIYNSARNILVKALKQPLIQILENAGCLDKLNPVDNKYFDAASLTYVDYKKAGIIDPTSVAINAITNSISVSSVFLTTEAAIIKLKDKE